MIYTYPKFVPVSLGLRPQIHKIVLESQSGISGWTFSNIYLFRKKYSFEICLQENNLLITGRYNGKTFFSVFGEIPPQDILDELLKKYDYWRSISEKQFEQLNGKIAGVQEDRNNFEYLYLRTDLAELPGRIFQKKRNLVNVFRKKYKENREQKKIDANTLKDALHILDEWKKLKGVNGDYDSAREALELHKELELSGMVFYVNGIPVGYCQGETLADNKSFAVHFEKAINEKGAYQYINQEFAKSLPQNIMYINREQDLGDEGLRQAKMTYRPVGFVKLFCSGKCNPAPQSTLI
ncbi:MAG: phosphatidylglycerol lysyltransferase domain-containing protein [Fibromonadaceae bacterium]|nr:phosphatidylglycerol lysyltransferase domain-containing protein [Fibromonadaceae bacterium]